MADQLLTDLKQPGLEAFKKILLRSSLNKAQVEVLLSHLDSKNYLFISTAIARHANDPQALIPLLKSAIDLSQQEAGFTSDVAPVAKETLDKLAQKPEAVESLNQSFSQEYPPEQTQDPSNYESIGGGSNDFLNYLSNKTQDLQGILNKFRSSKTGKNVQTHLDSAPPVAEAAAVGPLTETNLVFASAGAVAGGTIAAVSTPAVVASSALALTPTTTAAVSAPLAKLWAIENTAPSFQNATHLTGFGVMRQLPTQSIPQLLGIPAQPGFSYFMITEKGAMLAAQKGVSVQIGNMLTQGASTLSQQTVRAALTAGANVATKAAITATTAAAAGTSGAAAGATAAAAVGTAAGGPVIGAITGFLLSLIPAIGSWLKENAEPVLGGSAIFSLSLLTGLGLAPSAILGGVSSAGISALTRGGAGHKLQNLFDLLGSGTVIAVISPFILAILIVPAVAVFILFIINSSAFLVPPTSRYFSTITTLNATPTLGPTPPGGGYGAGYSPGGAIACIPGTPEISVCPDITTCPGGTLGYCSPIGEPCDAGFCARAQLGCPELTFCCRRLITATLTPTPPTP